MKNVLLLGFLFLFASNLLAQTEPTNWFEEGAVWHYGVSTYGGDGYTELKVLEQDTVIYDIPHKILEARHISKSWYENELDTFYTKYYAYQEGNQIYQSTNNTTYLIYDFDATIGDTMQLGQGYVSATDFVLDSIGVTDVEGQSLKTQFIRFQNQFDETYNGTFSIIEKIGSLDFFVFDDFVAFEIADGPAYTLRCYEDNITTFHKFSVNPCDYIPGFTATEDIEQTEIVVFPNPVRSQLKVVFKEKKAAHIKLFNVEGQQIQNFKIDNPIDYQLDLARYPNGVYLLRALDANGQVILNKKVIKQAE